MPTSLPCITHSPERVIFSLVTTTSSAFSRLTYLDCFFCFGSLALKDKKLFTFNSFFYNQRQGSRAKIRLHSHES